MKKLSKEKANKKIALIRDREFQGHCKNSIIAAGKAGLRAKKISKQQEKKYCKKMTVFVAGALILIGAAGLAIKGQK